MTAKSLSVAATIFSGPESQNATAQINNTTRFRLDLGDTVQTLSTNNAPSQGSISGLLFVPSLPPHDPCNKAVAQFVPPNVSRIEDVSRFSDNIIGLAPWVSPACTKSFLNATQQDNTEALIFFQPSSNGTGKPPSPDDSTWTLDDGGSWKTDNQFPVYAIPGPTGTTLMHQLAGLSQNSSNSTMNASAAHSGDVRLYTVIDLAGNNQSSNLWGFILAILGSILVLSIGLIIFYQFVQRRRRNVIRRRIEAGEIDVERLGLQHMKVPREVLEKLPIYPYPDLGSTPDLQSNVVENPDTDTLEQSQGDQTHQADSAESLEKPNHSDNPPESPEKESSTPEPSSPNLPEPATASRSDSNDLTPPQNTHRFSHSQTTCAICLDDFVPQMSTVRELPCGHIFHSSCIDKFLTRNSCLCPLCKRSVLLPGCYHIPILRPVIHGDSLMRGTL